MKMVIALYLKELKDARNLSCILAIGTLVLQAWVLLSVETHVIALFLSALPLWAIMFVLPFLLASSFHGEWRGNTTYLLFALPIRAAVVCLCKFAAILSIGLLLFAIAGVGVYAVVARGPGEEVISDSGFFRPRAVVGFRIHRGIPGILRCPVPWHRNGRRGRPVHSRAPEGSRDGRFVRLRA